MRQGAVAHRQAVCVTDRHGETGPLEELASINPVNEGRHSGACAAGDARLRLDQTATQLRQAFPADQRGQKQPVRLQDAAGLYQRARQVIGPVQRHGAGDKVKLRLREGQRFFIRCQRFDVTGVRDMRDHGGGKVAGCDMIHLSRCDQRRGQPASVAAKVERRAEAPVDVGQSFNKSARQAGLEEVKSGKVPGGAIAVASHGSAVKDGVRRGVRGSGRGHWGDMAEMGPSSKRRRKETVGRVMQAIWPADDRTMQPPLTFIGGAVCRRCAMPTQIDLGAETMCAGCIANEPVWNQARAALAYDDGSRAMVLALKHSGRRERLAQMGVWIAAAAADILETADILVPVPLHYLRLAKRGYNQSGWLASATARVSGVPMSVDALVRAKRTPSQAGLSPSERAKNVAGAFRVRAGRAEKVSGRRIVLVDDVLTTGATLTACTHALRSAGAANVDVLTLARVVPGGIDTIS